MLKSPLALVHVGHVVDATDLLLDGYVNSLLESLRVRTRIVGLQPDLRRGDTWELRYRQGRNCDRTDYDRKDRNYDCDNGPIDEELGHNSIPFAFCLINQRSVEVALVGLGLYGHSRLETLLAFDGHSFAGIQSTLDNPHRIGTLSDLHGTHADVVVLIDNSNAIAALLQAHGGLGNEHGVLLLSDHGADLAILPGAEDISGIRKQRRQLNRAGILIYLSIRKIKFAWMRICGSIGEDELQLPVIPVWVRDPLLEREILLFADSEIVSDGIDRRNCSQDSAAGVYQVPYLCLRHTGDAVNRGNNACETEVDTGRFDPAFAHLNLSLRRSNGSFCGEHLVFVGEVGLICIVEVLFADRIGLCQRSVLVYIELTHLLVRLGCSALRLVLNQLRLCLSQLRLCLVKRRLEWSRIDLE